MGPSHARSFDNARGCSLLEALVATTIVAAGVSAAAHLIASSAHANRHARQTTMAAVAAQQKLEDLLPAVATGASSPADALTRSVDGYSDVIDGFARRWSIESPADAGGTVIVQVVVVDAANPSLVRARIVTGSRRKVS